MVIEIEEVGYGIFSNIEGWIFRGIQDWTIACELYEMLLGDTED